MTTWNQEVEMFSTRMTRRFMEKQAAGVSGHERISETDYQKRAIMNILDGDYVDAANLCLLADLVMGT